MPRERDSETDSREEGDSPSHSASGRARSVRNQRPREADEDLVDPSPPPPDKPVIKVPSREEDDRSWLLRAIVAAFGADIVFVLVIGVSVSSAHWKQVEPLATRSLELLGTLTSMIIGFYFGRRGK